MQFKGKFIVNKSDVQHGPEFFCHHCRAHKSEHVGDKCLYLPTTFEPVTQDEWLELTPYNTDIRSILTEHSVKDMQELEDQHFKLIVNDMVKNMTTNDKQYRVVCVTPGGCYLLPGPYPTHYDAQRAGNEWRDQYVDKNPVEASDVGFDVEEIEQ